MEERAIDLLPEIPTLYSAVSPFQPGQELRLFVSGMSAAVSAVTDAGQAVAFTSLANPPPTPWGSSRSASRKFSSPPGPSP